MFGDPWKAEIRLSLGAAITQPPMTQPTGIRHFYFETPGGLTIEYEAPTTDDRAKLLNQVFRYG